MNVGHEYCMALKYPRSHSIAVSTVMVIPVQGQLDGAVRETPALSLRQWNLDLPVSSGDRDPYCQAAET